MTSLAKILGNLDPDHSLPLYPAPTRPARGDREADPLALTTRLPSGVNSRKTWASRASPCARRSTSLAAEGLLVSRQGSGNFVSHPYRQEFREADLVLRGHAGTRAATRAAFGSSDRKAR